MSLTVEEIKQKKSKLEADFLKNLKDFEKISEISIGYVEVKIDRHSYDEQKDTQGSGKKLRILKGVLDVSIEVNIANDLRSVDMSTKCD